MDSLGGEGAVMKRYGTVLIVVAMLLAWIASMRWHSTIIGWWHGEADELVSGEAARQAELITAQSEEERFDSIVSYFCKQFPTAKDYRPGGYFVDGTQVHRRIHINVPLAVEPLYRSSFSDRFLEKQLESEDSFREKVAFDLHYLQRPLLFTRNGTTISYDGLTNVSCMTCVVDGRE
jgi:hypothetical protein